MAAQGGWQRFKQEAGQELRNKLQQGADELSNALFSGQAYMPWPGQRQETPLQQAENAVNLEEAVGQVRADRAEAAGDNPTNDNQSAEHAGLYGSSYDATMQQSASRAQYQSQDRSQERSR